MQAGPRPSQEHLLRPAAEKGVNERVFALHCSHCSRPQGQPGLGGGGRRWVSVVGAVAKWWWVVQVGVSTAEPPHWPGQDRRLLQCPKEDGARAAPSGGAGAGVAVNLSERHLAPGTLDATTPSSRQLFAQTRHSRLSRFRLSNQYPREALLTIIGRSTRQRHQWHDDLPSHQCQNALGSWAMSRPQTLAPSSSAHRPCSTCSGSDHTWHMACHCLSLGPSFSIGNLLHCITSSTTPWLDRFSCSLSLSL